MSLPYREFHGNDTEEATLICHCETGAHTGRGNLVQALSNGSSCTIGDMSPLHRRIKEMLLLAGLLSFYIVCNHHAQAFALFLI